MKSKCFTVTDVTAIAAGYTHSVALKRDGAVVSWGNTPPAPAGLTNVVAIAAGRYGTLVAWGSANFGQLDIPAGLSGVKAMAMGDTHSVAVKGDGTVVVWGGACARPADESTGWVK